MSHAIFATRVTLIVVAVQHCLSSSVDAQNSRYGTAGSGYEDVVRTVRTPVAATQVEEREQTVYRQQVETQIYETQRNVLVPYTEYRWEPKWHGRFNPFRPPTISYHLVPHTRWKMQIQTVQTPVTRTNWLPEKCLMHVPVTTFRIENQGQVLRRPGNTLSPVVRQAMAVSNHALGGVARMENDPPRHGSVLQSQAEVSILR